MESYFKDFCKKRRVLFCGSEAPILDYISRDKEFIRRGEAYWHEGINAYFLRPRNNGKNISSSFEEIKCDIVNEIVKNKIEVIFLSLGGAAKILCVELAEEYNVIAVDFGAMMRSLTFSGSDGNMAARSTHTVFLFRISFDLYMDAIEKVFPDLRAQDVLAKSHAQLLLELQKKEVGWTHAWCELDMSMENREIFIDGYRKYCSRYKSIFNRNIECKRERLEFLHFCGKHNLTTRGKLFYIKFQLKDSCKKFLNFCSDGMGGAQ
jgi:hypothetical protein